MYCFYATLTDEEIQDFVVKGHYSFAEYAIVYWSEHLTSALEIGKPVQSQVDAITETIDVFLDLHFHQKPLSFLNRGHRMSRSGLEIFEGCSFAGRLTQAVLALEARRCAAPEVQPIDEVQYCYENNLNLEEFLSKMRSIMSEMAKSHSKRPLLEQYYGEKLFKCSRIDCASFFDGFLTEYERVQHEEKHTRRYLCTYENCIAGFTGFTTLTAYQNHVRHTHESDDDFQRKASKGRYLKADLTQAIEDGDMTYLEEWIARKFDGKHEKPVFKSDETQSKVIWEAVLRNPHNDTVKWLTGFTSFENNNARRFIVGQATKVGDLELVRRFLGDEFRPKRPSHDDEQSDGEYKYRSEFPWPRAVDSATNSGQADILAALVDNALAETTRKNPYQKKLRESCIMACRNGSLPCTQYLISTAKVDPFSRAIRSPPGYENPSPTRSIPEQMREWSRRSVLYHAIENGHEAIVQYLLGLDKNQFPSKPEETEKLLTVAAMNGHNRIVYMLASSKEDCTEELLKKSIARAELYKLLTQGGNEQLVETILEVAGRPYNLIDRHGRDFLMYAAFNGFEKTVGLLLRENIDVERRSRFPVGSEFGTAMDMAVSSGYKKIAEMIRKKIQEKTPTSQKKPLEDMVADLVGDVDSFVKRRKFF